MLAVYIVAAIVGGGLIVLSALGGLGHGTGLDDVGGHGASFEAQHDVDTGHDLAAPSDAWLPFLSLRFWTYFMGGFGGLGLLLTVLGMTREPATAALSAGMGLALGLTVAWGMRALQRMTMDNTVLSDDFLGKEAKVLVASRGSQPGKVRLSIKGDLIDMLARSESGHELEPGESVVVVAIDGNEARVERLRDVLGE